MPRGAVRLLPDFAFALNPGYRSALQRSRMLREALAGFDVIGEPVPLSGDARQQGSQLLVLRQFGRRDGLLGELAALVGASGHNTPPHTTTASTKRGQRRKSPEFARSLLGLQPRPALAGPTRRTSDCLVFNRHCPRPERISIGQPPVPRRSVEPSPLTVMPPAPPDHASGFVPQAPLTQTQAGPSADLAALAFL
jgi:hypothetical protein